MRLFGLFLYRNKVKNTRDDTRMRVRLFERLIG